MRTIQKYISVGLLVLRPCTIAFAAAPECEPRAVPEARFGARDIWSNAACPGIPATEEQSCGINDAELIYGVSEGVVVHKEAAAETYAKKPGYRGPVPFGLTWGQTLASAMPKIKAAAADVPFHTDRSDETTVFFSEYYCLRSAKGGPYALELWFDDKKGRYRIKERTLGP